MLRPTNDNQNTKRIIRPRGSAELDEMAIIKIDPQNKIKHYFRSADLLLKQARVYYNEGKYEHAYLLFSKYTNLGMSELCRHPSYNDPTYKEQNKIVKLNCIEALDALEILRSKLDKQLEEYLVDMKNPSPRELNNATPQELNNATPPELNNASPQELNNASLWESVSTTTKN